MPGPGRSPADDGEIDDRTLRLAAAGDRDAARTLVEIAARRSIDELRRQRPTLVADLEPAGDARGDDRAIRRELVAAIERALRDLSPELRAAFLLREYHG
ncbi:MAG TPA: hypothetical protein VF516_47910, partial [Kofleriaceae bacterium]